MMPPAKSFDRAYLIIYDNEKNRFISSDDALCDEWIRAELWDFGK